MTDKKSNYFKHHLSDVQSERIGDGTRIWQFVVVLPNAQIGKNCNICTQVLIENDVVIGGNVTVKSGVQLWDGECLEDNVFIAEQIVRQCLSLPMGPHLNEVSATAVIEHLKQ